MKSRDIEGLIKNSEEIVEKLGESLYDEGYDYDEYYGKEYKYGKLRINLYDAINDNRSIYVHVDDKEVLYYNENDEIRYLNGNWADIVNIIHAHIPSILLERDIKAADRSKKISDLESLSDYFKYYVKTYNDNDLIIDAINEKLENCDISVIRGEDYITVRNLCTGEDDEIPFDKFTIYKHMKPVAEFKGDELDPLPNPDHYVDRYKPGNWVKEFKRVLTEAKAINDLLTQQEQERETKSKVKRNKRHKK